MLGYNFPTTMDLKQRGKLFKTFGNTKLINKPYSSIQYSIKKIRKNVNEITINSRQFEISSKKVKKLTFIDTLHDPNNLITFTSTRKINTHEYIFINGVLVLKKLIRKTQFLKSIKPQKKLKKNFLTMDIETRDLKDKKVPFCLCFYDGVISTKFFVLDFKNPKEMIKAAILTLMQKKYHNHSIYLHNLSNFDIVFFFKILTSIPKTQVYPLRHNGKFINIDFSFDRFKIKFRDSYLMLPLKLRDLCSAFCSSAKDF
jgi:hypothetical protein